MREIVFDTETTGLDPYQGDRLVEIGCVGLVNGYPAGRNSLYHGGAGFPIGVSRRPKQGALLDADLLAEVYVELTGNRQARLSLVDEPVAISQQGIITVVRVRPAPLGPRITDAER